MPNTVLGDLSKFVINGNEMNIKDAALTETVDEIIYAIQQNNQEIGDRINDLHTRLETIEDTDYIGVTSFNGETGAVTYTAPVTSVNGQTGAVTIDTGVTSFNGSTGAVTYTAPVTSVNGQTGAVNITIPSKTSDLTNDSNFTTLAEVQTAIVNSAPETLDTLNELATALGNDPNFATTITNQIGQKYTKPSTGIPASDLADGVIPDVPVTSVNGMTGDVVIPESGVTSFNGETGAITYTAPVQSVNGQTGAVNINVGVTSFNGATGAITYTAPVTSVDGKTGAVTIDHPVTSVNGITGAVITQLSSNYAPNTGLNNQLDLAVGDTYENAFGKLEKLINVNEQISAAALNRLNDRINEEADPLTYYIHVSSTTTNVGTDTYDEILEALSNGRKVCLLLSDDGSVYYLPLIIDGDNIDGEFDFEMGYGDNRWRAYIYENGEFGYEIITLAYANHTHGDLQSNGQFTQDITIANGDKIVITDASAANANSISRSSITFDGSTTNQVLSKKGTWVNLPENAVTSVNGQTGAVTIDTGVTSFNGSTGAVTYTAPVTSVNGQTGAVTIDLTGKADKSAAIGSLQLSINSTDYKVTLSGTKVDGTAFTCEDVIDLPLETMVVSGAYDDTTQKIVLTLKNGTTTDFPVSALIDGLQSEITSTSKLSADLISDGNTNKVVTQAEKDTWNNKVDKVTSTDNAVVRFDGVSGVVQNSGVTIDDDNNISTTGNATVKNLIIQGSVTSNSDRYWSSDTASRMFAKVGGTTTPIVITPTSVRRGADADSRNVNLGEGGFPWNAVYAKSFVTYDGQSTQFVKGNGTLDSTQYAPLDSPAFIGTPTAPTAPTGTNTTQIATTAFVQDAVSNMIAGGSGNITIGFNPYNTPWLFYDANGNNISESDVANILRNNHPRNILFENDGWPYYCVDYNAWRSPLSVNDNEIIITINENNGSLVCTLQSTGAVTQNVSATITGTIASPTFSFNPFFITNSLTDTGHDVVLNANITPLSMTNVQIPVYPYTYQESGSDYTGYRGLIQKSNYEIAVDIKQSASTVTITDLQNDNDKVINEALIDLNDRLEVVEGISAGDENIIEAVKVNGTALVPDANKAVDINVPVDLADLTDDTTHRLVTDTEKSTWNNKVTSVNGQTGAVTIDTGVTSFNGSTGVITYTPPVTSVNDQTGAVTIDTGVTSFNGSTGAVTYTAPVTSVNGQTGAVNLSIPDAVTESTVAGWGFTKNTGTLTTETQLSKGTSTGTGNAVTDINVSNHQITLVKGKTFLETAPVTSVNGQTGAVTIDTGVTSFNGSTGAVTYTAPVTSVNGQTGEVNLTIPAAVTESTVSGWGFTKNTGTYSKPSTGIPASDLADGVIPDVPVQSVNGQTGAVTINVGVTSFNGQTGAITYTAPVTSVNGATGAVNINVGVTSFNGQTGAITYTAPVTSVNGATGAVTVKANVQSDWNATTGDAVILNKPTIPTVNDSTVTITMNGNTVGTFTLNKSGNTTIDLGNVLTSHQSIKTINNQTITGTGNISLNTLPTVSASDNGKVLMVVNGAWQLVSPVTLYSGSSAPNNSQGNNGDIYVQS